MFNTCALCASLFPSRGCVSFLDMPVFFYDTDMNVAPKIVTIPRARCSLAKKHLHTFSDFVLVVLAKAA